MASFGVYVPDNSELLKRIQAVADTQHDGKVSSYARAAIERDLAGLVSTDGMSPTILVDLTRQLLGEPAAENMALLCPPALSQSRELRLILEAYLEQRESSHLRAAEDPAKYSTPVELKPLIAKPQHLDYPNKLSALIGDKLLEAERAKSKRPTRVARK